MHGPVRTVRETGGVAEDAVVASTERWFRRRGLPHFISDYSATQDIWTRVFAEVGEEYPDIQQDHGYVDATCMWMIKKPEYYDTIVTPNLFGDIITDLAATLQGGMGVAASGNIHPGRVSMFEPIHGSAPKYAGKNAANPIATIAAVQMMLEFLGEQAAADSVESAVRSLLVSGKVTTLRAGVHGTSEIGDWTVEEMTSAWK